MQYQEKFQFDGDPNQQTISAVRYLRQGYQKDYCEPHSHNFYELDYTYDGSAEFEFENRKVKVGAGSLLLFSPLTIHSTIRDTRSSHMIIQVSPWLFKNNIPSFSETNVLYPDGRFHELGQLPLASDPEDPLYKLMQELALETPVCRIGCPDSGQEIQASNSSLHFQFRQTALILGLLAELLRRNYLRVVETRLDNAAFSRLHQLMIRLIRHPEEKLSMEDAAAWVNMGYSHFCRSFKTATGYTYTDFVNLQRVYRAKELLKYTDLSVTEISLRLNFGSISYFNRIFKKFANTPPLPIGCHSGDPIPSMLSLYFSQKKTKSRQIIL